MKKLSDINEGFMTRSLNRNKSGEERLGNKLTTNINELSEVDMGDDYPYVFSDEVLDINGQTTFTFEEISKYRSQFEINGWRLPTYDDIYNQYLYIEKNVVYMELKNTMGGRKRIITWTNTKNENEFIVPIPSGFVSYVVDYNNDFALWFFESQFASRFRTLFTDKSDVNMYKHNCQIRLIKDKK